LIHAKSSEGDETRRNTGKSMQIHSAETRRAATRRGVRYDTLYNIIRSVAGRGVRFACASDLSALLASARVDRDCAGPARFPTVTNRIAYEFIRIGTLTFRPVATSRSISTLLRAIVCIVTRRRRGCRLADAHLTYYDSLRIVDRRSSRFR
jgi:hypothetical protein